MARGPETIGGACKTMTAMLKSRSGCRNERFRSTVMSTSKSASARRRSWPFLIPDQPAFATVVTGYGPRAATRANPGTHRGVSYAWAGTRMCSLISSSTATTCFRLTSGPLEKLGNRIARLQVVDQRLHPHARPAEIRAPTSLGIGNNDRLLHRPSMAHDPAEIRSP